MASPTRIISSRGASPLGLPCTLSRAPLRRRAPFAWLPPPPKLRRTRRSAFGAKAGARFARSLSFEADPGIEETVGQVGEQVHRDVGDRDEEDAALHERIVACVDRLDQQP